MLDLNPHNTHNPHNPPELTLTPEAREALRAVQAGIEERLDPGRGDLFEVGDWANKLPGAVVRIAALLHLAEHGADGLGRSLDAPALRRAARISTVLIPHAVAALGFAGPPGVGKAHDLLRWVRGWGREEFSARDAFNALRDRGGYRQMETFWPIFELLEERGYIRRRPEPDPRPAGRPAVVADLRRPPRVSRRGAVLSAPGLATPLAAAPTRVTDGRLRRLLDRSGDGAGAR